ncbi:hypothetical protein L4X63_02780 [Geomonas sp. Red32]|uniref:hypothetical protein n=1 Tax=Geomonas sp. Red32 TaxID=2912856 RepID=UPI00202CCD63|nr:hypothetical protein [Geomonas sp. Red32]MCM0080506.1 hypothetical protein [Geomonas sp. Red32]
MGLISLFALLPLLAGAAPAHADTSPEPYRTPLAGEQCDIECLGKHYLVATRNRDNTLAAVLGGSFFVPDLGGHEFIPIGAFYLKHRWNDTRLRGTFSGFVNDVDLSQSKGELQFLWHVDNTTIPFTRMEIDNGREVAGSALEWGNFGGRMGVGLRLPVSPSQIDNDLRLQFFYQVQYLYNRRVDETAPEVKLPPDTVVHGPLVRVRYDGMRRNLMELPHEGMAGGLDVEIAQRAHWSDASYGGPVLSANDTRQYLKLSGYLTVATGLPGLSEKNRLLASFNGGFTPYGTLDRFSAYRIGGGPIPSEADDLDRLVYPGAVFGQYPASDYLIGALEYRREIFSFLYLHLRGTHAWVRRELFSDPSRNFDEGEGNAVSAGVTSGFLFQSELHLEYAYDSGMLRHGTSGGSALVLWSKSF